MSLQGKDLNDIANAVIAKYLSNRSRVNKRIATNLYKCYTHHQNKLLKHYFTKLIPPYKHNDTSDNQYNTNNNNNININRPNSSLSKRSSLTTLTNPYKSRTNEMQYHINNNNKSKHSNLSACPTMKNFLERQEEYSKRKSYSKERLFNSQEERTGMQCTFTPNISRSKTPSGSITSRESNPYLRLYYYDSCNKHNKDKNEQNSCDDGTNKKKISIDKIEKLYNDYKKKKKKKKSLRKKFDNEDGITFSPSINSAQPKYVKDISGDVISRSDKTVAKKKEFIRTFRYLRQMEFKRDSDVKMSKIVKDKDLYEWCSAQNNNNTKKQ